MLRGPLDMSVSIPRGTRGWHALIIYNQPGAPAERRSHAPWNSATKGHPHLIKRQARVVASDTSQGGAFGRKSMRALNINGSTVGAR